MCTADELPHGASSDPNYSLGLGIAAAGGLLASVGAALAVAHCFRAQIPDAPPAYNLQSASVVEMNEPVGTVRCAKWRLRLLMHGWQYELPPEYNRLEVRALCVSVRHHQ